MYWNDFTKMPRNGKGPPSTRRAQPGESVVAADEGPSDTQIGQAGGLREDEADPATDERQNAAGGTEVPAVGGVMDHVHSHTAADGGRDDEGKEACQGDRADALPHTLVHGDDDAGRDEHGQHAVHSERDDVVHAVGRVRRGHHEAARQSDQRQHHTSAEADQAGLVLFDEVPHEMCSLVG